MKITFRDGRLRIPVPDKLNPKLIDTGYVQARFYSALDRDVGELAVGPCINYPGQSLFTVSCGASGQGIMHLPGREEAECFALELLDAAGRNTPPHRLDFAHPDDCPPATRKFLNQFCNSWCRRRKVALPSYLAKRPLLDISQAAWDKLKAR